MHQLWIISAKELRRAEEHLMLLVKTAQERVVCFLMDMAARTPGAKEINLPMSRQNIADYLGLAIETVSRVVTQLESSGVIALDNSRHNFLMTRPLVERSDIVLRDNIDPKERLTNRHLY